MDGGDGGALDVQSGGGGLGGFCLSLPRFVLDVQHVLQLGEEAMLLILELLQILLQLTDLLRESEILVG